MVFSSIIFLFFFLPLVLGVYFIAPGIKLKNIVLLILSLLFYAWGEGELVLLMILSSIFNYLIGLWIDRHRSSSLPVFIGVLGNLLALIYFKYVGLIASAIDAIIGTNINNGIDIHLPIGISFFTFQSISYIVDLKRGHAPVQKNPIRLMLYISLFPQLLAGPIVRYTQIAAELEYRKHSLSEFIAGAKRFCLGLAKKVLIANVVGDIANTIFEMPAGEWYYATTWFAVLAYTIHMYFDFSGYSDMAIGLGRMFGFKFPENFNYPYIARSIKEFWQRWHITLSSWFKDYLYIPLGGNRKGKLRTYINLCIVFFTTGMWHGGTWNFVIWGLVYGFFLIVERIGFDRVLARFRIFSHVYVLLIVSLNMVFFVLTDFSLAMEFFRSMILPASREGGFLLSDILTREYLSIFIVGAILSVPIRPTILSWKAKLSSKAILVSWDYATSVFYMALLVLSALSIASSTYNPFIYFRF